MEAAKVLNNRLSKVDPKGKPARTWRRWKILSDLLAIVKWITDRSNTLHCTGKNVRDTLPNTGEEIITIVKEVGALNYYFNPVILTIKSPRNFRSTRRTLFPALRNKWQYKILNRNKEEFNAVYKGCKHEPCEQVESTR